MSESVDGGQHTSDQYLDPHCEPCYATKNSYLKEYGFCHICYQFLCNDCHKTRHGREEVTSHILQRGSDMPKSLSEKPPRYEICGDHPPKLKDQFCCDDNVMICPLCALEHGNCLVKPVEEVSKFMLPSDFNSVHESIRSLEVQAKSINSSIQSDLGNLDKQRQIMINETEILHDKIVSKIHAMYIESKTSIETEFDTLKSALYHRKEMADIVQEKVHKLLNEGQIQSEKYVDTAHFLKMQEIVHEANQVSDDIRLLKQSPKIRSCVYVQSQLMRELVSAEGNFGAVRIHMHDVESHESIINVRFPTVYHAAPSDSSDNIDNKANPMQRKDDTSTLPTVVCNHLKINASKIDSYGVKPDDNYKESFGTITAMAIIPDKRRLLVVDGKKFTVNLLSIKHKHLLSKGPKFYACARVPTEPIGVVVINHQEAVVSLCNGQLVFFDISEKQLIIKKMRQVGFGISGITSCNDKFAICCPDTNPPSVKLIDHSGKEHWSVSTDQAGKQLFHQPINVCVRSSAKDTSAELVVSDRKDNTLTILKADTGEVVATKPLKLKEPSGIACDTTGNVYVCYFCVNKVSVLSPELTEEKVLLTLHDGLGLFPNAVVYDKAKDQLIISNSGNRNTVDYFKLS